MQVHRARLDLKYHAIALYCSYCCEAWCCVLVGILLDWLQCTVPSAHMLTWERHTARCMLGSYTCNSASTPAASRLCAARCRRMGPTRPWPRMLPPPSDLMPTGCPDQVGNGLCRVLHHGVRSMIAQQLECFWDVPVKCEQQGV